MLTMQQSRPSCGEQSKQQQKAKEQLRMRVCQWANEKALGDLKFAGEEPFKGMSEEKAAAIKKSLVFFAESGACEAFDGLARHGHLTI